MPLKRPFLQLARIKWHLVVDTFKDGGYYFPSPSPLFFYEGKVFVICLIWIFKFYLTGFPVKCITNIKFLEAMFAGHFYSWLIRLCWLLLCKVFCTLVMQEIEKAHVKVSGVFFLSIILQDVLYSITVL